MLTIIGDLSKVGLAPSQKVKKTLENIGLAYIRWHPSPPKLRWRTRAEIQTLLESYTAVGNWMAQKSLNAGPTVKPSEAL